jgi:hypothetical protein
LIVHPVLWPQSLIHASGRYGGEPALADEVTNAWAVKPTMTKTSNVRFMSPKVSGVDPVELDPVVLGDTGCERAGP